MPAFTSIQNILAAFAIILIELLIRAGLDKVLALSGGPVLVGLMGQLQSVVELVNAVTLAGVLQGLTVMIAQSRDPDNEHSLLKSALKLGMGISSLMALLIALSAPWLADLLTQAKVATMLFLLAAVTGVLMVIPATLNAYWLGKHQQSRMLRLTLLSSLSWVLMALGAGLGLSLTGLMLLQCVALSCIATAIWRYLRKDLLGVVTDFRKLLKYVPVGLSIGILSPVSMLLIRGLLSGMLSWEEVGFLQGLWRCSDWVTSTAAGVLSLIFLPRLSSSGTSHFKHEMLRAGIIVLLPAACLLLLIYVNQNSMLSTLYDTRFTVSDKTAGLFLAGSWIRIASWLFLFGLYATHRTRLIATGELLSLPLLALLLWLFADGMTLERCALIYLLSYAVYLCFNAAALLYTSGCLRLKQAASV